MAKPHPVMLDVILGEPDKAQPGIDTPAKHKSQDKRSRDEVVEDAHAAKRRATANWIDGHISTEEHHLIHAKADHVIRNKGHV